MTKKQPTARHLANEVDEVAQTYPDRAETLRLREENELLETLSRTLMYTLCVVNEGETK